MLNYKKRLTDLCICRSLSKNVVDFELVEIIMHGYSPASLSYCSIVFKSLHVTCGVRCEARGIFCGDTPLCLVVFLCVGYKSL